MEVALYVTSAVLFCFVYIAYFLYNFLMESFIARIMLSKLNINALYLYILPFKNLIFYVFNRKIKKILLYKNTIKTKKKASLGLISANMLLSTAKSFNLVYIVQIVTKFFLSKGNIAKPL